MIFVTAGSMQWSGECLKFKDQGVLENTKLRSLGEVCRQWQLSIERARTPEMPSVGGSSLKLMFVA
jgi:hypothetical protein